MIAKEYTYYINEWFHSKFNRQGITFVNKESIEKAPINFGDRRVYKIEIWVVNFVLNKKEKIYTVCDTVLYENKKIKPTCAAELLKSLYILTFNNLDKLEKYGIDEEWNSTNINQHLKN